MPCSFSIITHTVDLAFEDPRFETDLLYTRVFGTAEKNNAIDDKGLKQLKKKIERSRSPGARIVGHSLVIIEDTAKIKEIPIDATEQER